MENILNNSKEIIAKFDAINTEAIKYLTSDFEKYQEMMKPINDWVNSIRKEIMRDNPEINTYHKVKKLLEQKDMVYIDSEYEIKSYIENDYDCGKTIWKMIILYKPLNYIYIDRFVISNF